MAKVKERICVKDYTKVTTKLKNGWLLSIGLIDTECEYLKDYITKEELKTLLMYVAEIINDFGVPQIGAYIHDEGDIYVVTCLNYMDDKVKHLHIRVN